MTPSALVRRFKDDLLANLSFFTRLPLRSERCAPDFRQIGWAAPLAGAFVGAVGGLALLVSHYLGFSEFISATLAVAAAILLTGAMHEDGLADVADGFGGGRDRQAKLNIMRDSRLGAYGVVALFLVLSLRVESMAALMHRSLAVAVAGLFLCAAIARVGALAPLAWLPAARLEGAGASTSAFGAKTMIAPMTVLALLATGLGFCGLGVMRSFLACAMAALAGQVIIHLARQHIGGQTGDVCGACSALTELCALLALLVGDLSS